MPPPSQITQNTADEFVVDVALQPGTSAQATKDNQSALEAAIAVAGLNNGIVQLPAGTFYFANIDPNRSVLAFDERSAGITIRGAGRDKTFLVPQGTSETIAIVSTLIPYTSDGDFEPGTNLVTGIDDIANYTFGDLLYFWRFNETGERSPRQLLTVVEVNYAQRTVLLSGTISTGWPPPPALPPDNFKHIKGARVMGKVLPGTRVVNLVIDEDRFMFAPGDDVVIGDGPGASQFFGEWAKVAAVEAPGKVTLAAGVRRSYADGLTCLVPGRPIDGPGSPRRHLADVTLCDFSVAGALQSTSVGQVRLAVRMQIVNVGFGNADPTDDPDPDPVSFNIALAECGRLTMRDCVLDGGLRCTVGQDVLIDNLVARSITNEEYGIDYEYINTTANGPGGWTSNPPECERINLTNCFIRNYGFFFQGSANPSIQFAKGSRITNLTITDRRYPPPAPFVIFLHASDLQLTNVVSDTQMNIEGQNLRLLNVSAPLVYLTETSSGILLAPMPPGVLFLQTYPVDAWRMASGTRLDGKFQSAPNNPVAPLIVLATANQDHAIAEFCTANGTPVLAVRADGNLATSLIQSTAPPGTVNGHLVLYAINGTTPIAYIPIHRVQ